MHKACGYIAILFAASTLQAQIKQGKFYFDSDSTLISEVFHYSPKDASLRGSYESFYINGSLKSYGWYKNNLADSIWTYYYENGQKKALGKFRKGKPYGRWKYYYENGNLKSEGQLHGSEKHGLWTHYFENGNEKSKGNFDNNKKIKRWEYFYEDGSLKAHSDINNGVGYYIEYYPSGHRRMEGRNIDDKSEDVWTYYYETGEIEATGSFEQGLKEGEWTYYHKNGQKSALGNYTKGKQHGDWKYFHENGNISQKGQIVNDKKDGFWKLFYPTGEASSEIQFEQGDGEVVEYYPSGNQKAKGNIENGKKHGKWYYYNDHGQLEGEAHLEDGKGKYTGYYPDGTIKMEGQIQDEKRIEEWKLYNPDGSTAGTYRPIYESEKNIFNARITRDQTPKESLTKPDYHPIKRGLRYFLPRINEYKGIIIGTNPLWLLKDELPIAVEYYIQERLGHEIQVDIIRSPFFTPDRKIPEYQVYRRGTKIHLKQKFYHPDSPTGMIYFGHQLNFKYQSNQVNHTDTLIIQQPKRFGNLVETAYGYGIFLGNRWMSDAGNSGLTIDMSIGVGVMARSYDKQYTSTQVLDNYFDQEIKSSLHFPITFKLNIGFALTRSKSKTQ